MPPEDPPTEILPHVGSVAIKRAPTGGGDRGDLIGRTLGKLTILEKLGKGGSGEVFRAEQVQLGRSAVIKVLRHEVAATPNRVERFLREAKLASRLDHPYAAHIYSFGAEPDGLLWIAMEHVRGITLDELVVKRGAMPAALFGPLFVRLCEVVHSAHDLGVVHRDIKGSNVMVIERAGQLLPKLLDFGIAKTSETGAGESSPGMPAASGACGDADELTGHGVTLGSPAYMAPEQWTSPHEVDARADIYALGVLAYRCVCGVLPFQRIERAKLGDAHQHLEPPPLPSSLPTALREVIMRALAKAPGERWPTAVAFGEAIQRAAGTSAPEAVPPFDTRTRETWLSAGPQPIADAIAHLTSATTTVEVDAALRELVAIACRWLAVLGLSSLGSTAGSLGSTDPRVREQARGVIGRDDGTPWLALARAAIRASTSPLAGVVAALAGAEPLAQLSDRLDDRDRARTAATLASDVAAVVEALAPLEPLLAYELVVGTADGGAESWRGPRRSNRERRVVWGDPLREGEVALLDNTAPPFGGAASAGETDLVVPGGTVVLRLSPLAQVIAPLPAAEPELFLLWRGGRGPARLVAAPWGFERDDEAAGSRLAALSTEDSDTSADPAGDRSPYPGLAAYRTADSEYFVGREREIESLANRLVRAPLLAVLGPSGVGKSSFIHAGVVPRLGEHYRILAMRPGRHPVHALAALPDVSADPADSAAIIARLRELGESAQRGVVIVIDQLEEIVTLCADAAERTRFAEIIAAAAHGPSSPVRVVATLRDDFATVIEAEPALRGRWDVFVLATPPPEALRRIVIEPARRMAVTVEPRVVEDMVAEIAGRPASLPLLSFTGSLLWNARDRAARQITYGAYLEVGGVQGALATYADQVFESLARSDQDTVRDLFARLVAADGTRIPASREDLEQLAGAPAVLAHLIDARLLVVREEDDRDVIEVVHECLAERWPRLARWRSEDAADRALLGDVRLAARRWSEARRADLLWRGEALAELRRLAARSTVMTSNERAFADAADRADRTARLWRRWLVVGAMLALATIAGVMLYLSLQANRSRGEAERSANAAHASAQLAEQRLTQGLIAQGRRELNDGRSPAALAYFGEALRRGADSVALREMIAIASRGWKWERRVIRPGTFTALTSDPTHLIGGDQGGTLHWWTLTGEPAGELATGVDNIEDIKPLPGGGLLVTGQSGIVVVAADRKIARRIKPGGVAYMARLGPGDGELVAAEHEAFVVYGPDGAERRRMVLQPSETGWQPAFEQHARFAIVGGQGALVLIDLQAMTRRVLDAGGMTYPSVSSDGSALAYVDKDRDIHFLGHDGREVRKTHGKNDPIGIVFSPTGDRFAAFGLRSVIIYDSSTFKMVHQFAIENDQVLMALAGDDLWTGGMDGTVRRYHDGNLISSMPSSGGQVEALELAGATLAVVTSDSALTLYDSSAAQLVLEPQPCEHPEPGANSFAILTTCADGETAIYVGTRRISGAADIGMGFIAEDAASGEVALSGNGVSVYDKTNKQIAKSKSDSPRGAVAFIDSDHIAVLEARHGTGLWKWAFRTDHWDFLGDLKDTSALAIARAGWFVAYSDGRVEVRRAGTTVVHITKLASRADFLIPSADGRWVAAQLGDGGTVVLDGTTGEISRAFPPADANGVASVIDPTGELVIRPSRGAMTMWERATGDELVWNLDLMKPAATALIRANGQIVVDGYVIGVLDIARDTRPAAQLLHDLDCRVPLRVAGSRLEPTTTTCQ
ncbi:MAG: serine/threonine-protein kinase [Deltaproteobacteria bacterium]